MKTKILQRIVLLTAVLPAVWVLLLGLLVLRTRDATARALYPMAKYTPFSIHFTLTQVFFLGFPLLAVASLVHILWARRRFREFRPLPAFLILGVSVLLSVAVIAFNPGGRFLWFFD